MDQLYQPSARVTAQPGDNRAAKWRDLRDWLDLVDSQGELKRIRTEVDPVEELSGLTFMVTRNERAPALLFENLKGTSFDARVLTNMLGNSKERYALSVGLDPSLSVSQLTDQTRHLMKRDVPPAYVDKQDAPVNETILLGEDIDLARLPAPKFWPGDGGRYLGTGDVTFTRDPESGRINVGVYRQMLHGRNRVGLYCSPGKHGRLDREAWWAKDQPCEVVAAYGVDPAIFMAGSLVFGPQESELGARRRADGRSGRTNPGRNREPSDPRARRDRH